MFRHETITAFSEIRLRLSGMRVTEVYEILCRGEEAELSLYWMSYEDHKENPHLQQRVTVPAAEMIDLLNRCGILKWDGFSGKNPPGLLDGTQFTFTATVNGDRRLHASGSNNYPKRYRDFTDALDGMLREG